jgi:uncharacterized protein involved in cysteine biosynthesis
MLYNVDMESGPMNKKLDQLSGLVKENNKMLKGMRSHQRWATFMKVLYWLIIIALMLGSYYFIQPYLENLINAYNGLTESVGKVREVGESIPALPDLGKLFGGG